MLPGTILASLGASDPFLGTRDAASTPEMLIEISRRLPTHITSHNLSITLKPVPSNCCFPGDSLLPTFHADVAGHDPRLAKHNIVNDGCRVGVGGRCCV